VFDQTLAETRAEFADLAPDALQELIDEATEAVRNATRETLTRAATNAR
jgi:hypothetical protein